MLKDNNWRKMRMKITVSEEDRRRLHDTIREDADFLRSINIIDYSLLVGIIDNDDKNIADIEKLNKSNGMVDCGVGKEAIQKKKMYSVQSLDKKCTYLMGIIDSMTHYGVKKKGEAFIKKVFLGSGVSCTNPIRYANRFSDFLIDQIV